MRKRKAGTVTVNAIAGTHVVFLGLDMKKADTNGLLGFAIQRGQIPLAERVNAGLAHDGKRESELLSKAVMSDPSLLASPAPNGHLEK